MRLIDADALKRKAQKVAEEAWKLNIKAKTETILNQFIDWIEDAPTIDSVRKGEWRKQNNEYSYWYECSECGCEPLWSRFYGEFDFSAFCPNCGAKMEYPEDIPMEYFENGGM